MINNIKLSLSIYIFVFSSMCLGNTLHKNEESVVAGFRAGNSLLLGFCKSGKKFIDMEGVIFIKNESIKYRYSNKFIFLKINGESIKISESIDSKAEPDSEKIIQVDRLLDKGDLDVNLTLILLNGEYGIYWRETFQHKKYRQGIYKYEGARLVSVCVGEAGINSSH